MTSTLVRGQVGASPRRAILHGAGAILAVLAIVVGIPVLLGTLVGWPLPHQVPDLGNISNSLTDGYVSDELLVNVIAVVCWLLWAQLVASIVLESIASIRGRSAATVPLGSGAQRVAGRLVAAIALLVVLAASRGSHDLATDVVRPLTAPTAVVTVDEQVVEAAPEVAPVAPVALDGPNYTVQRRDTLWDLAETHLGDPFRWTEIWELNRDVPQADGSALCDPDRIYPGWELKLPADAVGVPGVAPAVMPAPAAEAAPKGAPEQKASPVDDVTLGIADGAGIADSNAGPDATPDLMRPVPRSADAPTLVAPPQSDS